MEGVYQEIISNKQLSKFILFGQGMMHSRNCLFKITGFMNTNMWSDKRIKRKYKITLPLVYTKILILALPTFLGTLSKFSP
jgi:hypothetical protein